MTAAKDMKIQGEVLGLDSTRSSFVYHTSPSINDYNHVDLAPLYVAIGYISGFQGQMHNRIRGPGYTYDCALSVLTNEGQIRLILYRASDPVSAFNEFVSIVVSVILIYPSKNCTFSFGRTKEFNQMLSGIQLLSMELKVLPFTEWLAVFQSSVMLLNTRFPCLLKIFLRTITRT